ncbi:hypothetical protein CSAL01_11672 [Colletotrichum salicis]|uniref:Uncharacterized protein n=1 Tax=Colletotrichum salicis TaxID=1209931 RepID=A0A135TR16_9PEZI|nr:hypothetical protein CSAL01_11672 [Colletotrichum salicis]
MSLYDEGLANLQPAIPVPLLAPSALRHEDDEDDVEVEKVPQVKRFEGIKNFSPQDASLASMNSSSGSRPVSSLVHMDEIWDDWDLLPIETIQTLPNVVPNTKSPENNIRPKRITTFVDFNTKSFDGALPWQVLILSGMSGVVHGLLSSNPSYILCGVDSSHEVWNIRLKLGDLQAGDSGSWVIRESDEGLLGMVVARSAGSAYMVSFDQIRRSIQIRWGLETDSVGLPEIPTKRSFSQRHAQLLSDINAGLSQHDEATSFDNVMARSNFLRFHSKKRRRIGAAFQNLSFFPADQ